MQTHRLTIDGASIYTSYQPAVKPREDSLTLVIMHGAGQSSSERFAAIADFFLAQGVSVIALDFIGHGKTGGSLSNNSLALRTKHALAGIEYWKDDRVQEPLMLLGSSMGAHTALRVSQQLGKRVQALCLLQPAVYAHDAEDVYFTEEFTNILRRAESWKSSLALSDAQAFTGKVYVGIGSLDAVIPWGVITKLAEACKQNSSAFRLEVLHGAAHTLPEWMPEHAFYARQMVDFLINSGD